MEKVTIDYEPKERKLDALQEFAKKLAEAKKEKAENHPVLSAC